VIPEGQNLFIVDLEYTVPFESVEPYLDAHMAFIQDQLAQGFILLAGRKNPRTGGIIIVTAESLTAVQTVMETDPFFIAGVATVTYTEFVPSTRHPAFA